MDMINGRSIYEMRCVFQKKVRGYKKREKFAALKHFINVFLEAFANGQKFIVPYGNIPTEIVLVDHTHQFLGMATVLFSVAQKNICIKCAADLLCKLIADQHCS